jgi:hypothetical protein
MTVMKEPSAAGRPPRRRHDRGAERRLLLATLLLSAAIHGVAFVTLSFRIPTEPRSPSVPISRVVHVVPAMQAYDIVEVPGDAAPLEVQVVDRPPIRPLVAPRVLPGRADDAAAAPVPAAASVDPVSVRDRLRYQLATPQVWQPPSEDILIEPTPQEVVAQRIAAQLGEYNDSVAAEAAAHARAMDWTVKGEDGKRWGVSPGAIHLGSVTIPVGDTHFAVAAGRREEFAGRVRTWTEIQDQAVRGEARGTFKDRGKAIEGRMDRVRAARGAAPPKPPDGEKESGAGEPKNDGASAGRKSDGR